MINKTKQRSYKFDVSVYVSMGLSEASFLLGLSNSVFSYFDGIFKYNYNQGSLQICNVWIKQIEYNT